MHSKLSVRGNNHQFIRRLFKQFTTSSTLFLWVCMCAQKPHAYLFHYTTYAWQREKRKFYYRQNAVYPSSTLFLWVCICAQKPCMHDKERRGTCIIDKMLYIPVHLCVYVCVCMGMRTWGHLWICSHKSMEANISRYLQQLQLQCMMY